MEYEFQLRREAMKLCREQGDTIQAASWAAYRNQEHRTKHWITLCSIDKLPSQKARSQSPRRSKRAGKVLEVIQLYKVLLRRRRRKEKEDEAKGKKQQRWWRKKKKSTCRSLCRSPQQSWIQGSPQAQQDESWILLETELQAAPQLCRLR